MGKVPKSKKSQPASRHSRAARRATSPSINVDKSLKSVHPPEDVAAKPSIVLAARENEGVVKRGKAKGKQVKRAQRLRQERGLAMAEQVLDRRERKVEGSFGRERRKQERRINWDEINQKLEGKRRKVWRKVSAGALDVGEGEDGSWTDEEVVEGVTQLKVSTEESEGRAQQSAPDSSMAAPDELPEIT